MAAMVNNQLLTPHKGTKSDKLAGFHCACGVAVQSRQPSGAWFKIA